MSTIKYTDIARVARALTMQVPEFLTVTVSIGTQSITVNQVPTDLQVGMSLLIDGNNPSNFETVTITSINGLVLGITALTNNHVANAPIINVTQLNDFIGPASRFVDNVTNYDVGLGYESITETKEAYINRQGLISVPLSKPVVILSDVISATFQPTPLDTPDTLNLTQAWIKDKYFLQAVQPNNYSVRSGLVNVQYSGGFKTIPDDIVQATTAMVARFYKEKDSGYSDVIGMTDTGIMSYKKAMPADVAKILQNYKRVTE